MIPIEWLPEGRVRLIDQTKLPHDETYLETADYRDLVTAISQMKVRGAPLIGVTAAYALALASHETSATDRDELMSRLRTAAEELRATRPTAVNLAWALQRSLQVAEGAADPQSAIDALET
ncbi:MAG: S-methyl-5-thioribose-1-phosphate isomerase, partial [Dehalococcoidia bacterium]